MRAPSPAEQLQFTRKIERLLKEGLMSSTYKLALLRALADLSVERGDDSGASLSLPVNAIAEKFIAYYWRHVDPLPTQGGEPNRTLQQTRDRPLIIFARIKEAKAALGESLERAKRERRAYSSLVRKVSQSIKEMPLWLLQKLGSGGVVEFLYENRGTGDFIELKPGVVSCFRQCYATIDKDVRNAWLSFVRSLPANQPLPGDAELETFLFGSARAPLAVYRPVLLPLQEGLCFYCARPLSSQAAVDHFIPWARYAVDFGHNFVLSHAGCNAAKKHALAAYAHLKRWCERNIEHRDALARELTRRELAHDFTISARITTWAYGQMEASGGLVWLEKSIFEPLDPAWRELPGLAA